MKINTWLEIRNAMNSRRHDDCLFFRTLLRDHRATVTAVAKKFSEDEITILEHAYKEATVASLNREETFGTILFWQVLAYGTETTDWDKMFDRDPAEFHRADFFTTLQEKLQQLWADESRALQLILASLPLVSHVHTEGGPWWYPSSILLHLDQQEDPKTPVKITPIAIRSKRPAKTKRRAK